MWEEYVKMWHNHVITRSCINENYHVITWHLSRKNVVLSRYVVKPSRYDFFFLGWLQCASASSSFFVSWKFFFFFTTVSSAIFIPRIFMRPLPFHDLLTLLVCRGCRSHGTFLFISFTFFSSSGWPEQTSCFVFRPSEQETNNEKFLSFSPSSRQLFAKNGVRRMAPAGDDSSEGKERGGEGRSQRTRRRDAGSESIPGGIYLFLLRRNKTLEMENRPRLSEPPRNPRKSSATRWLLQTHPWTHTHTHTVPRTALWMWKTKCFFLTRRLPPPKNQLTFFFFFFFFFSFFCTRC